MGIQFSQNHVLKRLSFTYFGLSVPVSEISGRVCVGLLLGSLFCPIRRRVCFTPGPCGVDYGGFVTQSEIRSRGAASFVLISQDCFGYVGPFVVPYEFLELFS